LHMVIEWIRNVMDYTWARDSPGSAALEGRAGWLA
jgi:hypothetical protein